MNILSVITVFTGNNAKNNISDTVGFIFVGILLAFALILAISEIFFPPKYIPILKRTKNPYRRYKRAGYRINPRYRK